MRQFMLVLLVAVGGCSAAGAVGAGPDASRSFAVGGFDSVHASGSDTVRVVRGATTSVVATGPAKILERLDISTSGTVLNIARKSSMSWEDWNGKGATITVTVAALRGIDISGSGDASVDIVDGSSFEGNVSGSGSLALPHVRAASVKLGVRGSGDLSAGGKTDVLALDVTGSGNADITGLESQTAAISVRGSGNAKSTARKSATISVTGSGNVEVKGTNACTISKSGSGEARCSI